MNIFKKNLKEIFFYYFYNISRKIRIIFKLDQVVIVDKYKLVLPPEHLLSLYNNKKIATYRDYDNFLPNFIKDKNGLTILDIGANVGDTLVRMLSANKDHKYYCIEADSFFFEYLKKNVEEIKKNDPKIYISILKELVGNKLSGYFQTRRGTTGSLVDRPIQDNQKINSKKLDDIIFENKINDISLIKVDTDGFDISVLSSGYETIKNYKPYLFFEYMKKDSTRLNEYLDFISELQKLNYKIFIILNRHGKLISKTNNIEEINKILNLGNNVDIFCSV
mgnify:CR=1 FL=1